MKIVFSPLYIIELKHKFKTEKFQKTIDLLLKKKVLKIDSIISPEMPSEKDLLLAHSKNWVNKIANMSFSSFDSLQAEMPINKEVIFAHLLHCGGTMLAADMALKKRIGIHCGGGSHHAHRNYGAGFCLINDIAVAAKKLLLKKPSLKILIIDLDVHQGDGTAEILKKEKNIFTFSMHSKDIYPPKKVKSSLDIELKSKTNGSEYNSILTENINKILMIFKPDFIFYNAGADVFKHDLLGDLSLDFDDIERRDEIVFNLSFKNKIPLVLTLSGGYAPKIDDTAKIHFNTIKKAIEIYKYIDGSIGLLG